MTATREDSLRGLWLASLFVPGWAQLMLGRKSAFAWLLLALGYWSLSVRSALSNPWTLLITIPCALLINILSCDAARRLVRVVGNPHSAIATPQ